MIHAKDLFTHLKYIAMYINLLCMGVFGIAVWRLSSNFAVEFSV